MNNNCKKVWSRNQGAAFSIIFPAIASVAIGLFVALIFHAKEPFFEKWVVASIALYLYMGGIPCGGILELIFRKLDEGFCQVAGHILWYGTYFGAIIVSEYLETEASVGTYVFTFCISTFACFMVHEWDKGDDGKKAVKDIIIFILAAIVIGFLIYIK
jgi:hypothetical protein